MVLVFFLGELRKGAANVTGMISRKGVANRFGHSKFRRAIINHAQPRVRLHDCLIKTAENDDDEEGEVTSDAHGAEGRQERVLFSRKEWL